MGRDTRQNLRELHQTREERIKKYEKFFQGVQEKLAKFGLTMNDSALVCDLILTLALPNITALDKKRYRGVYKRSNGMYYSKITKNGVYYFLGNFSTPKEAALAYDRKCWELYGTLSKLNTPNEPIWQDEIAVGYNKRKPVENHTKRSLGVPFVSLKDYCLLRKRKKKNAEKNATNDCRKALNE